MGRVAIIILNERWKQLSVDVRTQLSFWGKCTNPLGAGAKAENSTYFPLSSSEWLLELRSPV